MNIARLSALLLFTLMLIPIDASAHCKRKHDVEDHPHCEPGDPPSEPGGEKAKFSVFITPGVVMSSGNSLDSHPWWTGSKHGIGEADPYKDALEMFDASYFADPINNTIPDAAKCFPASGMTDDTVREASIRERRGAMESMFWFDGKTTDGVDVVTYILHMGGELIPGGDFPPAPLHAISMMEMDHWRINVANGQSDVEPDACVASSGNFPVDDPVLIDVTAVVTPEP